MKKIVGNRNQRKRLKPSLTIVSVVGSFFFKYEKTKNIMNIKNYIHTSLMSLKFQGNLKGIVLKIYKLIFGNNSLLIEMSKTDSCFFLSLKVIEFTAQDSL